MTQQLEHPAPTGTPVDLPKPQRYGWVVPVAAAVTLVTLVAFEDQVRAVADSPGIQTWVTVAVSIVVSAAPFLTLGTILSGIVAAFVPSDLLQRVMPKNEHLKVCVAGAAGAVLPGCECASIPLARSLMTRGVLPAAALAFLLSAPAINPVVIAATFVAFPGQPEMVVARFVASLLTSVVVGVLWLKVGNTKILNIPQREHRHGSRVRVFLDTIRHDILQAGGFLVIGAMLAATANVLVPREVLETLGGNVVVAILVLALLAVLMAVCSEADAFVAASLTMFPRSAQLVFMVVGPAVDLKLIILHVGTFGKKFAARFVPLTLAVALVCASLIGWLIL